MSKHPMHEGPRSDEWRTPPDLWNELNDLYHFKWDLAASEENTKCPLYFSLEKNALKRKWLGIRGPFWLNPPFSKADEFFKKCAMYKVVAIYKSANLETKVWQDVILPTASWVCFLRGRVNYEMPDGSISNNVSFGSALIGYNVPSLVNHMGRVWRLR